jgi:hypothetical protein
MPSEEETKELAKDTSKRGQPIPPDVMEAAKSIAGDTNENNSGQQKETDANST